MYIMGYKVGSWSQTQPPEMVFLFSPCPVVALSNVNALGHHGCYHSLFPWSQHGSHQASMAPARPLSLFD